MARNVPKHEKMRKKNFCVPNWYRTNSKCKKVTATKKIRKILLKLPHTGLLCTIKTKPCPQAVIPALPVFLCLYRACRFAARPVQAEKHRFTRYHSLGTWFCYNLYTVCSSYRCLLSGNKPDNYILKLCYKITETNSESGGGQKRIFTNPGGREFFLRIRGRGGPSSQPLPQTLSLPHLNPQVGWPTHQHIIHVPLHAYEWTGSDLVSGSSSLWYELIDKNGDYH